MTKAELITAIAHKAGMPKNLTGNFLNAFQEVVVETIASGEKIQLVDFMTIMPKERQARVGRNPQNGEPLEIPARIVPKAVFGKAFRDAVAGQ